LITNGENTNAVSPDAMDGETVLMVVAESRLSKDIHDAAAGGVNAAKAMHVACVGCASSSHALQKVVWRWTPELEASLDWLIATINGGRTATTNGGRTVTTTGASQHIFKVSEIPGNDPFEKVAVGQELVRLGAVVQRSV
jgi:hypothetical protein